MMNRSHPRAPGRRRLMAGLGAAGTLNLAEPFERQGRKAMKTPLALAACALILGACATAQPTVYRPQASATDVGFAQYKMEDGRYRVTFRGGPGAPVGQVTDYALLRAAEMALGGLAAITK